MFPQGERILRKINGFACARRANNKPASGFKSAYISFLSAGASSSRVTSILAKNDECGSNNRHLNTTAKYLTTIARLTRKSFQSAKYADIFVPLTLREKYRN